MNAATVMDITPANMSTFGMCTTESNPVVAAATTALQASLTAAASGVPQPRPPPVPMLCVPVVAGPWSPGSKDVKIMTQAALNDSSKCKCMWAGEISITSEGQATVSIS